MILVLKQKQGKYLLNPSLLGQGAWVRSWSLLGCKSRKREGRGATCLYIALASGVDPNSDRKTKKILCVTSVWSFVSMWEGG